MSNISCWQVVLQNMPDLDKYENVMYSEYVNVGHTNLLVINLMYLYSIYP